MSAHDQERLADVEEAAEQGAVLEQHLIACGNIMQMGKSLYRWEGKVQDAEEVCVFYKTTRTQFPKLEQAIKELHPYDVPCIVALPIEAGHQPFLNWITEETHAR